MVARTVPPVPLRSALLLEKSRLEKERPNDSRLSNATRRATPRNPAQGQTSWDVSRGPAAASAAADTKAEVPVGRREWR